MAEQTVTAPVAAGQPAVVSALEDGTWSYVPSTVMLIFSIALAVVLYIVYAVVS
jgi:hypothetical protein